MDYLCELVRGVRALQMGPDPYLEELLEAAENATSADEDAPNSSIA